jgi:hypothetical protein
MAVEECLAVSAQLTYLDRIEILDSGERRVTEAFRSDIIKGVFAEGEGHYATCFRMVERAIGLDLGDLDLRAIGMLCELALDPPLPFLPDGTAADWSWGTLHPGARFRHLLDAAGQVGILAGTGAAFDDHRRQLEVDLLARAAKARGP